MRLKLSLIKIKRKKKKKKLDTYQVLGSILGIGVKVEPLGLDGFPPLVLLKKSLLKERRRKRRGKKKRGEIGNEIYPKLNLSDRNQGFRRERRERKKLSPKLIDKIFLTHFISLPKKERKRERSKNIKELKRKREKGILFSFLFFHLGSQSVLCSETSGLAN